MVIDFTAYLEMKKAQEAALEASAQAELARREHLEAFLSNTLAELLAA